MSLWIIFCCLVVIFWYVVGNHYKLERLLRRDNSERWRERHCWGCEHVFLDDNYSYAPVWRCGVNSKCYKQVKLMDTYDKYKCEESLDTRFKNILEVRNASKEGV